MTLATQVAFPYDAGMYYILNESGEPEQVDDVLTWGRWFQENDRQIVRHVFGDVTVSTVFLGLDHQFGHGPPLLYETMVFGGPLDCETRRYSTEDEARDGHHVVCQEVQDA